MTSMNLYRYIPFETLVDIVINKRIVLVSPNLWEDTHDGWLWKEYSKYSESGKILLDHVFAQCWCKTSDSIAMWNVYRYGNKAIMIESTREYLEALDEVAVREIDYSRDGAIDLGVLAENLIRYSGDTFFYPLTLKRTGFQYEEEVRLLSVDDFSKPVKKSKDIAIPDVTEFIQSVTVHPFAPEWYIEIVKSFCEKNNLRFLGKSKIYDSE